jgi:hypothetical protein
MAMLTQRLTALVLCTSVMVPTSALAQTGPNNSTRNASIDAALRDPNIAGERPRVIVRYRSGASAAVRQRLGAAGGKIGRELSGIGALSVTLPGAAVARMAADPDVLSISLDALVRSSAEQLSSLSEQTITTDATLITDTTATDTTLASAPTVATTDTTSTTSTLSSTTTVKSTSRIFAARSAFAARTRHPTPASRLSIQASIHHPTWKDESSRFVISRAAR